MLFQIHNILNYRQCHNIKFIDHLFHLTQFYLTLQSLHPSDNQSVNFVLYSWNVSAVTCTLNQYLPIFQSYYPLTANYVTIFVCVYVHAYNWMYRCQFIHNPLIGCSVVTVNKLWNFNCLFLYKMFDLCINV